MEATMPLPVGVPTVTVTTGQPMVLPDGTPIVGKLVFTGPDLVTIGTEDVVIGGAATATLVDGMASVALVPNDVAGMSPTGWTYRVDAVLYNAPPWTKYILLPSEAGPVELADVLVPDPVVGQFTTLIDPSQLGGAALLNVGTTGGTVAAGDDSRFGRVGTVAVSGTAASGKVLTATSSSAATWQAPTGGAGGATIRSQGDDRIDLEIVVLTNSASWAVVRTSLGVAIGKSVKAAAGDRVLVSPSFMYTGTQYELDLAVMGSDGTSITRYAGSSGSGTTPGAEGYPPLYTQATSFPHAIGPIMFTVAAGEVDGSGMFTVNLAYHAPSLSGVDQKIYAGSGYIARWVMLNIGPEPA